MRFPESRAGTGVMDEAIAFQSDEVRPDRIIGHFEGARQISHGAWPLSQEQDDLSAGAVEKASGPTRKLHDAK